MPKAKVMPPRTPRGESAKVTIANQANQIKNLMARIQTLDGLYVEAIRMRDAWQSKTYELEKELVVVRNELSRERNYRSADVKRLEEVEAKADRISHSFEGYRMCVRDMEEAKG